jgi:3-oxoacyl-[acyl-carrier-protein] synthase II
MRKKILITGMGAVTPLGNNVESTWAGLIKGASGVARISLFDPSDLESQIAAEVRNFDPIPYFRNGKDARRSDRYCQFAVAAAREAFLQSGLHHHPFSPERGGVIIGSSIGGISTLFDQAEVLRVKGAKRVSPFLIPMLLNNIAAGTVAIELGLNGPSQTVGAACATANQAIADAARLIQAGEVDFVVAGGSEAAICELFVAGFCAMKALSTRNDEPVAASRPFDRQRDGFVIAEGAGIVVLESEEHALRRGALILAELAGTGSTTDAGHLTHPHGDGHEAARAMTIALREAAIAPSDVSYVNAHATSTPVGDRCEAEAIRSTFGDYQVSVTSTKSMTGHMCGATGAVELIAAVKSIQEGLIPPTINLDDPDPECPLNFVAKSSRATQVDAVLSNSFGFGGHNSTLVVKRY